MQKTFKKKSINRMNYIAGHLRGVKKMLENDKYCIDVIKQNEAVIAAIKQLNYLILENHLQTCVSDALKGKNEREKKKKIRELIEIFKKTSR